MSNIYNLTDTWNAAGTTFTAIKMNVTDTASAAGSRLIDLQVAGSSRLYLDKSGALVVSGPVTASSLTLSSALALSSGGTGATTAAGARVSILPALATNGGRVLAVNAGATDVEWITLAGGGSVTSVNAAGGSTGLTFSGGPITGSGTLTLGGVLALASGGTGAVTPAAARVNLLPSYSSNANKVLTVNAGGTDVEWIASNSVNRKYTAIASGTTGQWFPIFNMAEAINGPVTVNIRTFAHSSVTFIAYDGYGPSGLNHIVVLGAMYNPNSGYANISGVRVLDSGQVEIQFTWSTGPVVDIDISVYSAGTTPSLNSALNANAGVVTVHDTVDITGLNGRIRTENGLTASAGDIRAPLFRDLSNAAYFLEPANTGTSMTVAGDIIVQGENLGIRTRFIQGKASPTHVAGPLYLQYNSSNHVYVGGGSGAANLYIANGNLGVGTTGPGAKIESSVTSAGATVEVLRLSNPGAGANTQAQMSFYTTATLYGTITGGYSASAPQMTFNLPSATAGNYVWQISGTERLRVGPAGQIGLGGANYGSTGQVLTSQGAGSAPIWASIGTGVTSFNTRTGAVTLSSADVTSALTYTPPTRSANAFPNSPNASLGSLDLRTMSNPLTGLGYAGGGRFRFSSLNDNNSTPYADVIDLSTYTDASGGGFNSLYLGKNSQVILHKYAAAGGTAWTTKTIAYTDSNITGTASNITGVYGGTLTSSQVTTALGFTPVNYTLPKATATTLGGVEVFDATVQTTAANAVTTTASRTYGVQLNAADQMVVNVPWVDTTTDSTKLPLAGGTMTGALTLASASGLGNGNPRSLITGYSGGNYGQTGYGIAYTTTSDVHNYAINDAVSLWEAFDGLRVRAAPAGTVGTPITWTTVLDARRTMTAMTFRGNAVLDANNYNSYAPTLTGTNATGTWGINISGNAANITGTYGGTISSSQITTGLGFTPYNATNPNGYTSNTGTVTGVTGTAPIVSSGGTAPAISISAATTSAAGSMSAADKTKLDGIASGATASSGTVTSVSVVSANGLAGTVATPTTTPAITLSTSISGLLKGNGTAISAAVAGTDYVIPSGSITGNAGTATTLQTARLINGVSFNGSANITITDGSTRFQSSSDFVDGTLVTTDIPANVVNGNSFIIEITGKSYSSSVPPFKAIAQGYLYNNTITSFSGINYGGAFSSYIKVFEDGGVLKFWWPRITYWNSFNVNVMSMDSATNGNTTRNRVTAIANSLEPTGTKKVQINLATTWNSTNFTPSTYLPLVGGTMTGAITFAAGQTWPTFNQSTTGSAATLTTARTLTIGSTGKTFNGSANVSWSLAEIGAAAASHTHTIAGITDATRWWNNFGDNHSTRSSFDTGTMSIGYGWRYVQGSANGPGVNGATQYYSIYTGLGNDYPATGASSYGMQIAFPRNVTTPYITIRYNENNSVGAWQKISAGYADTAGTATSVTSITSAQVTTALGFTPYNATNPNGYITGISSANVTTALGFTPYNATNPNGYITGISSANVTTALGFTPYNATNPSGYITSSGSITGSAGSLSANSNYMVNRGTVAQANVDTATLNGFYIQSNPSDSQGILVFNPGGSLGPLQMTFTYTGLMQFRNRTDSATWTAWKTVLTSANFNTYAPTLTGGGASGTWGINVTGTAGSISGFNNPTTGATANTIVYRDGSGDDFRRYGFAEYFNMSHGASGSTTDTIFYSSGDNYIRKNNATGFRASLNVPTRTGGDASGTWGISVTGSSASASTLSALGNYVWSQSTLPTTYPMGVQASFVGPAAGEGSWQNYGSVMTMRTYSGGGGSLQLYVPYGPSNGGVGLQARFGNYNVSNGNAWTSWKTLLASDNFNSYSPTLTGGGASGTWGINVTGNAATVTGGLYTSGDQLTITGTKRFYSPNNTQVNTVSSGDRGLGIFQETTNADAYMTFHISNDYAAYFGLGGAENDLVYGGWSAGANRYRILHTGNYTSWVPSTTGTGASGTWGINISGTAATATSADQIDGVGFRNTGSNASTNADTIESNGITYYGGGVPNFTGNATDGALYSQAYSASWQHQIAGDYRSGQIALRGKNNGTWQSWRTVLDSSNYSSYALPLAGGTMTGQLNGTVGSFSGAVYASNWFRSYGQTGWYNETYGGGVWMDDATWVRVYNSKAFYVANQIAATGDITAYYSDERLKTKTGSLDNAVAKIQSLNGFTYVENDLARELGYKNNKQQVGVSAQEVQAVLPEAVSLAPVDYETLEDGTIVSKTGENYLTVDYSRLVPLLIEAVKEQQVQIDELKNMLAKALGE